MLLNALYYNLHREPFDAERMAADLDWLAAHGVGAVTLRFAARDIHQNASALDAAVEAIRARGMAAYGMPSYWAGHFRTVDQPTDRVEFKSVEEPPLPEEAWVRPPKKRINPFLRFASVYREETRQYVDGLMERMLRRWPLEGLLLLNPQLPSCDMEERVRVYGEALSEDRMRADLATWIDAVGLAARARVPGLRVTMILPAYEMQYNMPFLAALRSIDDFGAWGEPFHLDEIDLQYPMAHGLLWADRIIAEGYKHGKDGAVLLWTHSYCRRGAERAEDLKTSLPQLLEIAPEHAIFTYYPRFEHAPDRVWELVGEILGPAAGR